MELTPQMRTSHNIQNISQRDASLLEVKHRVRSKACHLIAADYTNFKAKEKRYGGLPL